MALYGHEISESINVWEAGLERYCKMDKGEFIGRTSLERAKTAGLTRTLVGLEMIERGIARDEYRCCNEAGEQIGVVTSGSPSPTLGKNIALAYLPPEMSALGTIVHVEIRSQKSKAQVVATPFYKRARKAAAQPAAKTV
jgi:aminomethyltransferase